MDSITPQISINNWNIVPKCSEIVTVSWWVFLCSRNTPRKRKKYIFRIFLILLKFVQETGPASKAMVCEVLKIDNWCLDYRVFRVCWCVHPKLPFKDLRYLEMKPPPTNVRIISDIRFPEIRGLTTEKKNLAFHFVRHMCSICSGTVLHFVDVLTLQIAYILSYATNTIQLNEPSSLLNENSLHKMQLLNYLHKITLKKTA